MTSLLSPSVEETITAITGHGAEDEDNQHDLTLEVAR